MYGSDTVEQFGNIFTGPIAPTRVLEGDAWFNTTTNVMSVYTAGAWVEVAAGGATITMATQAEVNAGTNTTAAIAPDTLRGTTLSAPTATPANDANRIPRLNAQGKIDTRFLDISPMNFMGSANVAAAVPKGSHNSGEFYFHSGTNNVAPHSSWGLPADTTVSNGDFVVYDGTAWHFLASNIDPDSYLLLSGGTMTEAAHIKFDVPAGAAPAVPATRLNGTEAAKSALDGFTISGGSF